MKINSLVTFLILFTFGLAAAETHTLKGKVTVQSSGDTPIVGAQVTSRGATPVRTYKDGRFNLIFLEKKAGSEVFLEIKKEGYEIVNEKDLHTILRADQEKQIKIYMCVKGMLAQNRMKYYNIAESNILKRHKMLVTKLEKEKKLDRETIDRLEAEKQSLLKQAKDLADKFARVNFDDVSEMYKEAFSQFQQGNIKQAIKILDTEKLVENIDRADKEISKVEQIEKEIEERKNKAKITKEESIKSLILKARLCVFDFQFELAETQYEIAIAADPTNFDNILEFADYLREQNQFNKALPLYKEALSLAEGDFDRANALNSLGILYGSIHQFPDALSSYKKALEIAERLEEENPGANLPHVATILNNLGALYNDLNRHEEALKSYNRALEIREKLAAGSPAAYLPYVATTLNNLGVYYWGENNKEALSYFLRALKIREELTKSNPPAFELDLCTTMLPICFLYKIIIEEENNEAYIEKGLALVKRAITILKKYREIPRAQGYMKYALELKEYFEKGKR